MHRTPLHPLVRLLGRVRSLLSTGLPVVLVAAACSSGGPPASNACTAPTDEPLDPSSGLHVLRPDEVTFDELTPTSGPHVPTGGPLGLADQSIPPAQQLAILERGSVLVSVRSDAPDLLTQAGAAFGDVAVVHPVDGLPGQIVVTAWRTRISCSALDADYVSWFIDDRTGRFAADPDHG